MLSRAGHRVTTAENGAAALAAVSRDTFDVILMDVQMPEVDGVTATQWIRDLGDSRADTPIIALTADTMTGSRERFLTAGFSDYLEKPVRAARLLEAIARHLQPVQAPPAASAPPPAVTPPAGEKPLPAAAWNATAVETLRDQLGTADFEQVIDLLSISIDHDLRRLRTAIDLGDYDTCHVALQNLSENAAQLGADGLVELVQRLSVPGNSVETVLVALPQVQTAADRLLVELTRLRKVDDARADASRA
jgi:CheY-like chemotaxis protein